MFYELVAKAAEAKRCCYSCQRVSCQRSGAASISDGFHCAPGWGNHLQKSERSGLARIVAWYKSGGGGGVKTGDCVEDD